MSRYDDPHFEIPDPTGADVTGWCSDCHEACHGTQINIGIGPYEFQGSKGFDRRMVIASHCCHAGILESNPNAADDDDFCLTASAETSSHSTL